MTSPPLYISASRRTDIPRFFAEEFFDSWRRGAISYDGGYGRSYTVSLKKEDVAGYIFWSKDFSPLVRHPDFARLIRTSNAVFHYTINDCSDLEPCLAPLEKRIETLHALCDMAGPQRVLWRFDPVCKYLSHDGSILTNKDAFHRIIPLAAHAGVTRCYFSFMSFYNKLKGRNAIFAEFSLEEKQLIGREMLAAASQAGMKLFNCCNEEVPGLVPGIFQAHCIDGELLRQTDCFGMHRALAARPTRKGCGCFESRDIGSYSRKCPHGCLYCYANPLIR